MNNTIEEIIENVILINGNLYEYRVVVGSEGMSFERSSKSGSRKETLQIVENTIKANKRKRELVWRSESPSYDSGYSMFYIGL